MNFYRDKEVLVAGGTGLIGVPLVNRLIKLGARVTVASLDNPDTVAEGMSFFQVDLRELNECLKICKDKEIVFNLTGVKGSPAMTAKKPASFFVPTISLNTNIMEAARRCGVDRFLYTSSIGVYSPSEIFHEDDVWNTFPSPNDRFAGWAKRMGELQAEAYAIEYGWERISIVRPANVYGPFDNFDPGSAMVIPSLINRATSGENPLLVWGDGSQIRDFVHADDVARGMLVVVEKGVNEPINLGSGVGISIKSVVDEIVKNVPGKLIAVKWDPSKPSGDQKRLMDTRRAKTYGITPKISIPEGIEETVKWYVKRLGGEGQRYNAFHEKFTPMERR